MAGCPTSTRTCAHRCRVAYAVFHQRYATNTRPVWRLAQPFRSIAHNGEINTVRGNREEVRGRAARRRHARRSRATLLAAGPLLSPDGSDSLSLDEALELLMATGWDLTAGAPDRDPRGAGASPRAASACRHAAPPDGRVPRAVGRPGGASSSPTAGASARCVDRNGLRPAAFAVTRDRLVAVASEAGAVPFTAAETVRRGRLGPGELLLVEPGRRAILEDAEAKAWALRALPIHDAPRPMHEDRWRAPAASRERPRRAPTRTTSLRYLAGLDAERARLDIKTMALEAHEPLWSMGDDTPTPGRGRLDRPVADHLRQAFAQVTNPAIDPERERIVMDLRVELGRRPALLGGLPRGPRTAPPGTADRRRPRRARSRRSGDGRRARPDARRDVGSAAQGRPVSRPRWTGWRPRRVAAAATRRRGAGPDRRARCRVDRLPVPSILAVGRGPHGPHRGRAARPDRHRWSSASDVLDVHAMAMVLAVGATRRPSAAGHRAGRRARRHARRRGR